MYRGNHTIRHMGWEGWVASDLGSSPGWWAATVASCYLLPKQAGATVQIKVHPTHVSDHMNNHVMLRNVVCNHRPSDSSFCIW